MGQSVTALKISLNYLMQIVVNDTNLFIDLINAEWSNRWVGEQRKLLNSKSKRGKHLIALLSDMAKQGNDIQLEHIPKAETIKALDDAHKKIGFKSE